MMNDPRIGKRLGGVLVLTLVFTASVSLESQWVKGAYLASTGTCPPFVFVTMPLASTRFGTDVADQFGLGDPGRQLMFMAKELSQPVLLFPRQTHLNQGLINSPALGDGSVHEPSVYHDLQTNQYWAFFAYANDLRSRNIARPCEIYAINVTAAVSAPTTFNPDTLPVSKLTSSPTTASAIFSKSFNPTWSSRAYWAYTINTHFATNSGPCVVDEEQGPTLYFASNQRRAGGFGLMAADLKFTASSVQLLNMREIQHFGTTSLITFFETPGGCGGAYQSSTESTGQWSTFEFQSDEGFWTTASGYANGVNISDHNGTTVAVGDDPLDSEIAVTRYYLNNNESFGSIMLVPYKKLGLNTDDKATYINQVGMRNLFPSIDPFQDNPSWVGKFAMPSGGRKGIGSTNVELFLTYSTNCSNQHNQNCSSTPYHATLVVVTSIAAGIAPKPGYGISNPSTYANPAFDDSVGVYGVLKHPSMHAFWMRPLLTHEQRFGWKHRNVSPLFGKPTFASQHYPALKDMPIAKVMAGPIYNTDVRALRRRLGGYDPTTEVRNGNGDRMALRVSCLTKDVDPESLKAQDVWGIRLFATDPTVQRHYYAGTVRRVHQNSGWGYLHHSGGGNQGDDADAIEFERTRLLSDIPAESDGTISFLVPANVAVKFSLLHADGTVLAPHRAHHSFAPAHIDNRCWGCHQHGEGKGIDPRNMIAFQPGYRPFNTLTDTGKLEWNQNGTPVFTVHQNTPSLHVPEFKRDVWPLLKSECGSCHDSSINASGPGLNKFNLNMPISQAVPNATLPVDRETAIWSWLHNQRYINRRVNAAKSPLAWYFSGVADDNTVRLDGETNSRYKNAQGSKYWITTSFGSPAYNPHPGVSDKRKAYKVIEWIDDGAAIDHDDGPTPPYNAGGGVNFDGYQIALSAKLDNPWSGPQDLIVGFWDVENNVNRITVSAGSTVQTINNPNGGNNGTVRVTLPPGLGFLDPVSVEAVDQNDNHSRLEKSLKQLYLEAEPHRREIRLSVNQPVFQGGQNMVFSIASDPSHAGEPYFFLMSFGIYPGTPVWNLGLSIYDLPNWDALLQATFNVGVWGYLDGAGKGTVTLPVPSGSQPTPDMFCLAMALRQTGAAAKSNLVAVKIK